jgi:hypothetical protein
VVAPLYRLAPEITHKQQDRLKKQNLARMTNLLRTYSNATSVSKKKVVKHWRPDGRKKICHVIVGQTFLEGDAEGLFGSGVVLGEELVEQGPENVRLQSDFRSICYSI